MLTTRRIFRDADVGQEGHRCPDVRDEERRVSHDTPPDVGDTGAVRRFYGHSSEYSDIMVKDQTGPNMSHRCMLTTQRHSTTSKKLGCLGNSLLLDRR